MTLYPTLFLSSSCSFIPQQESFKLRVFSWFLCSYHEQAGNAVKCFLCAIRSVAHTGGFILKINHILYAVSGSDFLSGLICSAQLDAASVKEWVAIYCLWSRVESCFWDASETHVSVSWATTIRGGSHVSNFWIVIELKKNKNIWCNYCLEKHTLPCFLSAFVNYVILPSTALLPDARIMCVACSFPNKGSSRGGGAGGGPVTDQHQKK